MLEQRGLRLSGNREFFNMPINEAIDIVVEAKQRFGFIPSTNILNNDDSSPISSSSDDFLDELTITTTNPWHDIWESAEACYYGLGDSIQDYQEALKLYKQAAKLGCSAAYLRIGTMYRNGEGCIQDQNKALEYLKEGVRRGDNLCYAEMYKLFDEKEHHDNARKCWDKFIDGLPDSDEALGYCFFHVVHYLNLDREPMRVKDMHKLKDRIVEYGMDIAERFEARDAQFAQLCRNSLIYIKNMA